MARLLERYHKEIVPLISQKLGRTNIFSLPRLSGGTVAVDIGDYKEIGTDKDGKPFERLSRFTNVWVLKEGKWQCVSGHASSVPVK